MGYIMSTSSGRNSGLLSLSSSNAGKEQWWERRRNVRGEKHTRGNILIDMSIPFIWGFYHGPLFSHLRRPPSTYHILLDSGQRPNNSYTHTRTRTYIYLLYSIYFYWPLAFPYFISTIPKTFVSTTQRGNPYSKNHAIPSIPSFIIIFFFLETKHYDFIE